MLNKAIQKFIFQLNEKEILYKEQPCSTYDIFQIITDTEPLVSSELAASNVLNISRQNRFIKIMPHCHDFIEVQYIYCGNCIQNIQGKEIHLKKGDVCIVDVGTCHSIEPAGENDIYINILLRKDYYSSTLLSRLSSESIIADFLVQSITNKHNENHYLIFHTTEETQVRFFMDSLMNEYFGNQISSFEVTECYLVLLFSELLRCAQYSDQQKDASSTESELLYILKFVEANYKTCTLTSVAKQFGYHPNYLSALLHKQTGQTFKEIIHKQRLKQAALFLKKTPMSIYGIAEEVGYSNLTYFYKKFREYYGLSPQNYRNKFIN